ncbi:hypothetical protein H9Q08_06960 [Chryseobacterium sp. PS-8]|uniref:Uncharacterized protein n=1 Tax=Chryseobacterium indicum TaxID=2766954 RepID=A0ABS9C4C7_9FLAO|nr:hypothetical protein [Chryseobacterium sp. PS-8]MCF2219039.1 hypothetical protein [Chryseobacterium sp. PS-8]
MNKIDDLEEIQKNDTVIINAKVARFLFKTLKNIFRSQGRFTQLRIVLSFAERSASANEKYKELEIKKSLRSLR